MTASLFIESTLGLAYADTAGNRFPARTRGVSGRWTRHEYTGSGIRFSNSTIAGSGTVTGNLHVLVAELTSAFLCAELGLDNSRIEDSASYVSGWLDLLNQDRRAVMVASSQARQASDFIKGTST